MFKEMELANDIVDALSTINDEEDILDFVSDSFPALRIFSRSYEFVSDTIFKTKINKFLKYAKEFTTSNSFEKFKLDMQNNPNFRTKVSEYVLFKINKFDADYKLKIFSRACTDFFNSNINENTLIEISEVIDNLNTTDIDIIKYLYQYNSDLVQVKKVVDELLDTTDDFKTYSSILKLTNYGIVLEESQSTWGSLKDKHLKQICLSPFAKTLHKYL